MNLLTILRFIFYGHFRSNLLCVKVFSIISDYKHMPNTNIYFI